MKRQLTGARLTAGTALAISAVPAMPAAAATRGSETFSGTIVTSGVSGTPHGHQQRGSTVRRRCAERALVSSTRP